MDALRVALLFGEPPFPWGFCLFGTGPFQPLGDDIAVTNQLGMIRREFKKKKASFQ